MMPPDPEKVMRTLERLKDVFQEAADNSTGPAQPHFVKLSDVFNRAIDKTLELAMKQQGEPDMRSMMMSLSPALIEFQMTVSKIQKIARTDAAAAESLRTMEASFRREIQELMGDSFGGAAPSVPPAQPPAPPAKPSLPRGPRIQPKKPDDGDFNL